MKKFISVILISLLIASLAGCNINQNDKDIEVNEDTELFAYNDEMQVYFNDATHKKSETIEISFSEDEASELIDMLNTYSNELSYDVLKEEFLSMYTIEIDDITVRINADYNYSVGEEFSYMFVKQEGLYIQGTYINEDVVKFLDSMME